MILSLCQLLEHGNDFGDVVVDVGDIRRKDLMGQRDRFRIFIGKDEQRPETKGATALRSSPPLASCPGM